MFNQMKEGVFVNMKNVVGISACQGYIIVRMVTDNDIRIDANECFEPVPEAERLAEIMGLKRVDIDEWINPLHVDSVTACANFVLIVATSGHTIRINTNDRKSSISKAQEIAMELPEFRRMK